MSAAASSKDHALGLGPEVQYPGDATLSRLFEARVASCPDAPAVVFEGRRLRYAELNRRANRLARHLRRLGVGADVPVGVFMERSLEMVVALYAILKAGGAYVPLDPEHPAKRLAFMLEDTRVPVILAQRRLAARLPGHGAELRCLDDEWHLVAGEADADLESGPAPGDLAYLIYTSGSTGRPKGVMNEHRGICNRLFWMQDAFGLGPDDRVLQKTPFSFDVSVWEFFWPLLQGARLVLARPGGHREGRYLRDLIAAERVTTLHFVPSMLQVFLDEPELERCASLRRVIVSGEALPFDLMQRCLARLPAELHNLYGPTEAAVDVTHWRCRPGGSRGVVPIGRPIANTRIHILDERLAAVGPGQVGELHIGGVQVARGYWRRPELTAERFVPDPFAAEPGARLYKTGDLARFLPDGEIEYLGRLDFQVKIRGFRVELGEIEAALVEHPALRECAVSARPGPGPDPQLVAYLVPHAGAEVPGAAELRAFLARSLPAYMLPAAFVALPRMPLSPNGKLDRKALPDPVPRRAGGEGACRPPRTPLERYLVELWREVLGVGELGIGDDYFELGGDSLQGARIVGRLGKRLGEPVYIVALFDAPSVEALALYLEREYPAAVARVFGSGAPAGTGAGREPGGGVDAAQIAAFRELLARVAPRRRSAPGAGGPRPRALFVLAPPRSGSTLLRVMLAGHSRLFAPQELELLAFDSLREMQEGLSGKYGFWLEGALRALMEVARCGPDEARHRFDELARGGASTARFYALLQDSIGGRMLVEKTPSYALHRSLLERMELEFREPLYIHLQRHPCAVVGSFAEVRLDQVFFRFEHPYTTRELGELIWLVSHENISAFLSGVAPERQLGLHFEDLLREPRVAMQRICDLAGLDFEESMLHPYRDQGRKMTDGLHAVSLMRGDPKFHGHRGIDPAAADRWRREGSAVALGETARRLAARIGYAPLAPQPRP